MKLIKSIQRNIQSFLAEKDIIIQKKTPLNSEDKILEFLLNKYNIDYVLDIGANTGQFVLELLKSKFNCNIISFEPLPDVYKKLEREANKYHNWKTENLAIGQESGSITINVSANTESSSILPMLDSHSELAPESKYVNKISVPITTLDKYISENRINSQNIYLKIDVQGYEESVIIGAINTLENVKVLQLEISFTPLYDQSIIYYKMIEKIENIGFTLYSFLPAFTNYKTGQIFQVDAIFVKK